jgi:hypothetical protein
VTLDINELAQLVRIIDGVYEGKPPPRVGGRFGQYLRRCSQGRFEIQQLLAREGIATSARGWVSGVEVGPVELAPLAQLKGAVPNDLWGPVEHLPALAESLGSVVDLTLWTSAASANRAHVALSSSLSPIRLVGTYRWFAPSRLTTGEADVDTVDSDRSWTSARFLKATADDISRSAHALEYVLDYRLGEPGLKAFRAFVVRADGGGFSILSGVDATAREIALTSRDGRPPNVGEGETAMVFAYVEPWSREWTVIDAKPIDAAGCLVHLATWADFKAELDERPRLTTADLSALRNAVLADGLHPPDVPEVIGSVPPRQLSRPVRALVRWLRYRR